jgi:hypothetical protein
MPIEATDEYVDDPMDIDDDAYYSLVLTINERCGVGGDAVKDSRDSSDSSDSSDSRDDRSDDAVSEDGKTRNTSRSDGLTGVTIGPSERKQPVKYRVKR